MAALSPVQRSSRWGAGPWSLKRQQNGKNVNERRSRRIPTQLSGVQHQCPNAGDAIAVPSGLQVLGERIAAAGAVHATLQQQLGARPALAHIYKTKQQAVMPNGLVTAVVNAPTSLSHANLLEGGQHAVQQLSDSGLSHSNCDSTRACMDLWSTGDAGDVVVEVVSGDVAGTSSHRQQRYPQHHRHRRRLRGGCAADRHQYYPPQQQLLGNDKQQPWQPVLNPLQHVQLLQHTALVRSWSGALRVLAQQHNMQQAHVGLLWWQLMPRLRARQHAAADGETSGAACDVKGAQMSSQMRVRQVLHQLCNLTQQYAKSMSPQSLGYALQGIAAAVAAGEVVTGNPAEQLSQQVDNSGGSAAVPYLNQDLVSILWSRLLEVAGSCTAQQLARCLAGGQRLGWQLTVTSTSSRELCCWPILEAACSGMLAAGGSSGCHDYQREQQLQQWGPWNSSEAGDLLVSLAQLLQPSQARQQPPQHWQGHHQQWQHVHGAQWHQQHPAVHEAVQTLLACACQLPAPTATGVSPGQRMNTYCSGREANSTPSSVTWPRSLEGMQQLQASVSVLQSAAVLGVLPDLGQLERLLEMLEAHLDMLPANHILQALAALLHMHIEPWESWLRACFVKLESDMHLLSHEHLLQLLLLLPQVSTMQPSKQLLHRLARFSAVHCYKYSWEQLAALPEAFAAVGYRPPPYWFKDYLAATSSRVQQQQQQEEYEKYLQQTTGRQQQHSTGQQQQQQLVVGVQHCVAAVVGGCRLGHPAPGAWLSAVQYLLTTHLQEKGAACTAVQGLAALRHLKHAPSQQLLSLLATAHCSDSGGGHQVGEVLGFSSLQVAGSNCAPGLVTQTVALHQEAACRGQQHGSNFETSKSTTISTEACVGGCVPGGSLIMESKQDSHTSKHKQWQQPDLTGPWQLESNHSSKRAVLCQHRSPTCFGVQGRAGSCGFVPAHAADTPVTVCTTL